MKIGILTFHRAHNYGAVLQAYALKEYLKSMHLDVEVVDYVPTYFESSYKKIGFKNILSSSLYKMIRNICFYPQIKKRNNAFINFIEKKISPSQIKYTEKDIIEGYDVLVYGSDQIWNGVHTNGPDNVFWGYSTTLSTKKIVYAASSSVNFFKLGILQYVKNALSNFDYLSLREENVLSIIKNLTDKYVEHVVDPTLLLSKEDWESKFDLKKLEHDYILVYQVRENPLTLRIAKEYAKKHDLKIIILTKMVYQRFDMHLNQTASPEDFVQLIKNATLVLTTSFHGTIFSLIFRKNFYTIDINSEINERSLSILSAIGLQDRLISAMPIQYTDVDYNEFVISRLNKMIDMSKLYLKKSIYENI